MKKVSKTKNQVSGIDLHFYLSLSHLAQIYLVNTILFEISLIKC